MGFRSSALPRAAVPQGGAPIPGSFSSYYCESGEELLLDEQDIDRAREQFERALQLTPPRSGGDAMRAVTQDGRREWADAARQVAYRAGMWLGIVQSPEPVPIPASD